MPRLVDKQQKSEAISRSALRVFRKLGYHKTRMTDIAGASGVGKGTLYEYFENKSDILRFAFDRYFEAFKVGAIQAMSAAQGPADRVFALVEFALDHAAEWEDHCAVYVDYLGLDRSPEETLSLSSIYGEMRGLLLTLIRQGQVAGSIRQDVDPTATTEALLSIYDGIVLHRVIEEQTCDMTATRSAALAIVTQGLRSNR